MLVVILERPAGVWVRVTEPLLVSVMLVVVVVGRPDWCHAVTAGPAPPHHITNHSSHYTRQGIKHSTLSSGIFQNFIWSYESIRYTIPTKHQ